MSIQLHNYGMRLRSLGIGCQPPGHYDYRDSEKSQTGYYGIVTYARMLTPDEIKKYELTYIEDWTNGELRQHIEKRIDALQAAEASWKEDYPTLIGEEKGNVAVILTHLGMHIDDLKRVQRELMFVAEPAHP